MMDYARETRDQAWRQQEDEDFCDWYDDQHDWTDEEPILPPWWDTEPVSLIGADADRELHYGGMEQYR